MNLTKFLNCFDLKNPQIPEHKVWLFVAPEYPLLFFSWFIRSQNLLGPLHCLDSSSSLDVLVGTLDMSFLGMPMTYWLGDNGAMDSKQRDTFFKYLNGYQGPHRILLFSSLKKELTQQLVVDMNQRVDKTLYATLAQYSIGEHDMTPFGDELFKRIPELSLDQACMMIQYQKMVGKRSAAFFTLWFEKIIVPEQSLFSLSQHLFAKNKRLFLSQWQRVKQDYADEFWPVFWAEQLWQAYWFVKMMERNQLQEARAYARRLPFSFIERTWRNYTSAELASVHARVYHTDYLLKNGCSLGSLELLFLQFMHGHFV